jgi:hypothetical protein
LVEREYAKSHDQSIPVVRFDREKRGIVTPDSQRLILKPAQFVHRVNYYLNKQANVESFCYTFGPGRLDWDEILRGQLDTCNKFVFFWSGVAGEVQTKELKVWKELHRDHPKNSVLVRFFGCHGNLDEFPLAEEVSLDELYTRYKQKPEQSWDRAKPDMQET